MVLFDKDLSLLAAKRVDQTFSYFPEVVGKHTNKSSVHCTSL